MAAHRLFLFKFSLPDGDHIGMHNTVNQGRTSQQLQDLADEIKHAISQNPDAVLDVESIVPVQNRAQIQQEIDALRAEDPDRPLAVDLGLDRTNRLLTNPEVARTVAAARRQVKGVEA